MQEKTPSPGLVAAQFAAAADEIVRRHRETIDGYSQRIKSELEKLDDNVRRLSRKYAATVNASLPRPPISLSLPQMRLAQETYRDIAGAACYATLSPYALNYAVQAVMDATAAGAFVGGAEANQPDAKKQWPQGADDCANALKPEADHGTPVIDLAAADAQSADQPRVESQAAQFVPGFHGDDSRRQVYVIVAQGDQPSTLVYYAYSLAGAQTEKTRLEQYYGGEWRIFLQL